MNPAVQAELRNVDRLGDVVRLGLERERERPDLDLIVDETAEELHVPVALLTVLLDRAQAFVATAHVPEWLERNGGVPAEWSLCADMLPKRAPLTVPDLRADPTYRENPLSRLDGARSYAGVPLVSHTGHMVGSLCVIDAEPRDFGPTETEALTRQAARAIDQLEWAVDHH